MNFLVIVVIGIDIILGSPGLYQTVLAEAAPEAIGTESKTLTHSWFPK